MELKADIIFGRGNSKGKDTFLREFFSRFKEEFFGIKTIDLGCGRFRQVEDNHIVFFPSLIEEGSSILIEYMDPLVPQGNLCSLGQELEGETNNLRVELDIINLDLRIFKNLA